MISTQSSTLASSNDPLADDAHPPHIASSSAPAHPGRRPPAQPLFACWEIVRLLNALVPWPYPPDGCLAYYRDIALPAVARGEEWHWAICLPQTQDAPETFIGAIGLMLTTAGNPNNRGLWIGLPWQGQGYATEACAAVTRFWFETLEQPSLTVPKATGNTASRRISERAGMTLLRTEPHAFVSGILPAEIWFQTREDFLLRQRLESNKRACPSPTI